MLYLYENENENENEKKKKRLGRRKTLFSHYYFPAYEWLMDDLRDYRFFEADLIHPNTQAVDYVWQKFSDHYFDNTTHEINRRIEKINKSLEHRPFNPDSKEHHTFVNNTEKEIQLLSKEYPWMKF